MGVDVAPTVNIAGGPLTIQKGTLVTVSAVVADPGEYGTFNYNWSATDGGDTHSQSGTSASFGFDPNDPAAYTVTLIVTDADGNTVNAPNVTIPASSGPTYSPFQPDVPTVSIEQCDADGTLDSSAVEAGNTAYFLVSVGEGATPVCGPKC
jgi:hypothetical protein